MSRGYCGKAPPDFRAVEEVAGAAVYACANTNAQRCYERVDLRQQFAQRAHPASQGQQLQDSL